MTTQTAIVVTRGGHRFYVIDGAEYESVTTALSIIRNGQLEHWRGDVGNDEADRIRDEAASLGTLVHAAAADPAAYDLSALSGDESELAQIVTAYREWSARYVERVISVEQMVVSRKYRYAGTPDAIVVMKGDTLPTLIDIKTSKAIWKTFDLQTAAYWGALAETGIQCGRRLILRLGKGDESGRYWTKEYGDHQSTFVKFVYCLSLYRFMRNGA